MQAFGIFEGGGVRGYAHIGALKAAEERGFIFNAVAGSSIGAIVAAFVAAGFTSDELYSQVAGAETGVAAIDPRTLFRREDWTEAVKIRRTLDFYLATQRALERLRVADLIRSKPFVLVVVAAWFFCIAFWIAWPILYIFHHRAFNRLWSKLGLMSSDELRRWLDAELRTKLKDCPPDEPIRFRHLKKPLLVAMTDVTHRDIVIAGRDLDEPLVDAVIASATFPYFFLPVPRSVSVCVDGGLLSNAPAWVFDDERIAADRAVPTLAFRLPSTLNDGGSEPPWTLLEFTVRLLATGISGAKALQFRRIDNIHLIDLPSRTRVLALETVIADRASMVSNGYNAASAYLDAHLGLGDFERVDSALRQVAAATRGLFDRSPFVRASIVLPVHGGFQVVYSANMDEDIDDRLFMRADSFGMPQAFLRREPVLITFSQVDSELKTRSPHKYEVGSRPPTVRNVYMLPIFSDPDAWIRLPVDRDSPVAALVLDFDIDVRLSLLQVNVEDRLAAYAQVAGEQLKGSLVQPFKDSPYNDVDDLLGGYEVIVPGLEVSMRKQRNVVFPAELSSFAVQMLG